MTETHFQLLIKRVRLTWFLFR